MREWLDHYKSQGVQHFFLLNNNSKDDFKTAIGDDSDVEVKECPGNHLQVRHYNDMIKKIKEYTWCIIVDLDEFMYARGKTILDYTRSLPEDIGQVLVHWKMFGSSGLIEQPDSVRKHFTWCQKDLHKNTKAIVKTSKIMSLVIHSHKTSGKTITESEALALNHYPIQSKHFFAKVKMTRGSASCWWYDNVRNWKYFEKYDHKEIEDTELSNLV